MKKYQALLNELCSGCVLEDCDGGKANCELYVGFKELVNKATPKKPITGEDQDVRYASIYECPNCHKMFLGTGTNYCYRCGQALDWGKEDGQDN